VAYLNVEVRLASEPDLARPLLVPAIMRFAGTANWWLPSWLERILPRIRVD